MISFHNSRYQKSPAPAGFFFCARIIVTLSLAVISFAAAAIEPYSAIYQVAADGISLGRLERSLTQEKDGAFALKAKAYTTGFWAIFIKDRATEVSRFTVIDDQVTPISYHYINRKRDRPVEERVRFDLRKKTIQSTSTAGRENFPYTGTEVDKLLYQFKIRDLLRQGESEFGFDVVDRTRLKNYQFKTDRRQTVDIPMGKIEAIKVKWVNADKRKTTLWFAPSLDYLPVKIVQDSGSHKLSISLISTTLQ